MTPDPFASGADLALRPAHELLRMLRSGEVGALELLDHHIARIERLDPAINAVVVRDFERARERARAADAARASGVSWGPLHGLPMTVKESFQVPGLPNTWGFAQYRDQRAEVPAVAVRRLLDAGAIILGKTNVPVALADWQSFNPIYGSTGNPWDPRRTPGGSSGGSAAALAAGLSALELGSDIGASIRNPAHYCGVYGHKPTWGVVPMAGHELPGDHCHDQTDIAVCGPLARSAVDLQLALEVVSAPLSAFGPMGRMSARWADDRRPLRRSRVALILDDPVAPVDASVQGALRQLADFLRTQGVSVDEQARPVDSLQGHRVYMNLLRSQTGGGLDEATWAALSERARDVDPQTVDYPGIHWRASTLSHRDWLARNNERALLRQQWQTFFETFDFVITPVATTPAFVRNEQGERWERMIPVNGQPQPTTTALFWAGYPGVVGLPATAIPLGLCEATPGGPYTVDAATPHGLPVGAQIIGPAFADPSCLRMAAWLEREWRGFQAPPMARGAS